MSKGDTEEENRGFPYLGRKSGVFSTQVGCSVVMLYSVVTLSQSIVF